MGGGQNKLRGVCKNHEKNKCIPLFILNLRVLHKHPVSNTPINMYGVPLASPQHTVFNEHFFEVTLLQPSSYLVVLMTKTPTGKEMKVKGWHIPIYMDCMSIGVVGKEPYKSNVLGHAHARFNIQSCSCWLLAIASSFRTLIASDFYFHNIV